MSISRQLSGLCQRSVSREAQSRTVSHVVDWLGCAAIGASTENADALWQATGLPLMPDHNSNDNGERGLVAPDPWRVLLYEASLGNIMEMDDVHRTSLVHPGSAVVPAALFLARHTGASGSDILTAVVRGYEAMIRFGMAVGPQHYSLWHNTATCGVLGAAATACSLLRLDQDAWVDAFGHAVTQAAGLWQVRLEPCMSKQWHVARATQTGVQAALYARAGITGPRLIFEGEKGYFKAKCPDGDVNLVVADQNEPWRIFDTSFKPWPACRHAHASIDAALVVREHLQQAGLWSAQAADLPDAVQDIQVHTYRDALAFCDQPDPDTPGAARFSLQHAVAVSLLHGPPQLGHFEPDCLNHSTVHAMRNKVHVHEDLTHSQRYPQQFSAWVQVRLADGRLFQTGVDDAWGDPERPMSRAEVYGKARSLLGAAGWASSATEGQLDACTNLFEHPEDITTLLPIRHDV